jgi:hypothetical protein
MKNILMTFAQQIDAGDVGVPTIHENVLLRDILNLTYYVAGIIAVIVIIAAGIFYVISSGDAGRVAKAKNLLLYSVIGLIIVMSAFVITNFVIGSFN